MEITLNGERKNLPGETTISAMLAALGIDMRKVAVERNRTIVPRSEYEQTPLSAGDAVEIVHFIGGG